MDESANKSSRALQRLDRPVHSGQGQDADALATATSELNESTLVSRDRWYQEAETLYYALRRSGDGRIDDGADVEISPDGRYVAFTGTLKAGSDGPASTRVWAAEVASATMQVLTTGPHNDRLPKYSPDGRYLAFLSDRAAVGRFQLCLLDVSSGVLRSTPAVSGRVEYLQWASDGRRILLGVAGHGTDVAGVEGAVSSKEQMQGAPAWAPTVLPSADAGRWRRPWIYDVLSGEMQRVDHLGNCWESTWCGPNALAAVVSSRPDEGDWYRAQLALIDLSNGQITTLFAPQCQLGKPCTSPSGRHVAVVTGLCSDRGVIAGELHIIETSSGAAVRAPTADIDVTFAQWRSDSRLLLAGHRGLQTVVALYDRTSATLLELWSSTEITTGGVYASVCGFGDNGDCALIGEGFVRPPELALIRSGRYQRLISLGGNEPPFATAVEHVAWQARDGQYIQGWLLRRRRGENRPAACVMHVHGGPVWHWRPTWLGRRALPTLKLLQQGYAIFLPNPRGSSGRGQTFAREVVGDVGGADAHDCLSGLDHLVARGWADPTRLGVMGTSYGGFMTCWLITQDQRFAAAVAIAPITNHVTQRLISNIPSFCDLFLVEDYRNVNGKYFTRSPLMHAHRARTPTLNICGALDRCTPAEEAMQFHAALVENAVPSMLVIYPQEGHGVRNFPATIDYTARLVRWFEQHMPADVEDAPVQ